MQGFIKNKTKETVAFNNWVMVECAQTTSSDAGHDEKSRPLPGSGSISHVDFIFANCDADSTVFFDLRICYDSAGRDPVLPPLRFQLTRNGRVSPNVKQAVIAADGGRFFFTAPSTQTTTGSLYVFINPTRMTGDDDLSMIVDTVRIHWSDES